MQSFLRCILKEGPIYPVLFKYIFGSLFYPVLLEVYFE